MTKLDPIVGRARVLHYIVTIFLQNSSSVTINKDLSQFANILLNKHVRIENFPMTFPESWAALKRAGDIDDEETPAHRLQTFESEMTAMRKKLRAICVPLFSCFEILSDVADDDTAVFASGQNTMNGRLGGAAGLGLDDIPTNSDDGILDVKERSIKLLQTQRELAIANMKKLSDALLQPGIDAASKKLGEATLKNSKKEIEKYELRLSKLGAPVDDEDDGNK